MTKADAQKTYSLIKSFRKFLLEHKKWTIVIIIFFCISIGFISNSGRLFSLKDEAYQLAQARGKFLTQVILTAHILSEHNALKDNGAFDNSFIDHLNSNLTEISYFSPGKATYRLVTDFDSKYDNPTSLRDKTLLQGPHVSSGLIKFSLHDEFMPADYFMPIVTTESCLQCHSKDTYKPGEIQSGIITTFLVNDFLSQYKNNLRNNIILDSTLCLFLTLVSIGIYSLIRHYYLKFENSTLQMIQNEKMTSLGMMTAGFAHEINTPIGIAVGAASQVSETALEIEKLFERDEVSTEEVMEPLTTLRDSSNLISHHLNRAHNMIKKFKTTAGDLSFEEKKIFVFTDLFEDIKMDVRHLHKNTNITFDVSCPKNLSMYGSVSAIKQIIYNMYSNAIKYAFLNATIKGKISLDCHLIDGQIKMDFSDDGCGMDANVMKHMFEPFYTTGRDSEGTGLGMFIVYQLVTKNLSGTIKCYSKPGLGTHLEILMPYVAPVANNASPEKYKP